WGSRLGRSLQNDPFRKPMEQFRHFSIVMNGVRTDHQLNVSQFTSVNAFGQIKGTELLTGQKVRRPDGINDYRKIRIQAEPTRKFSPIALEPRLKEDIELRCANDVNRNLPRLRIKVMQFVSRLL